ncbi:hypothetical protein O3G_MSEX005330 [Manduca sexta]|uniref:Uncharacterized protein n=1 Tax=Manduca sexta TaxID=7130 RepID=A0A921YZB4_MANSE|nr:hypothetical protein O3G_MSEX005330 [Manduca sexta]
MGPIYGIAAIILLAALSKGELPEDDFRIINRQDLLAVDSDIFEDKSSKSFSQLLFDVARDQLIVGARDVLYRLSLRGLRELERAEWPAPAADIKMCQVKGQSEEDCHNYVKVLLSYGHKIFACGTNAFSPICSWREIESINTVSESVTGVALSPYNPHSNVTAVLASNGDYYAGTPTDFSSSDTAICRSRGASSDDSGNLCTAQYDFNRLNEPQFVGSFEDDRFVYFVYREIAVEYMNCGKIIYSRIARVCKNDSGGYLMKDKWSTFLKARLKCLVPGDIPFYYDEIQSVEYLPQEKMLVATFTTPTNSITGSAVCVYNMSDIHAAFEGPYKVQDSRTFTWDQRSPSKQAREHFQCITDSRAHEAIEFHGYHLMYEAVLPISGAPIYKVTSERFTHVTVDVTSAKNIERQLVAFVATDSGYVLKLAVLPRLDGACLVEKWKLRDEKGGFDVQAMQFVKDTMSVYIGSSSGVVRLGAARCARHASRGACVGAADPHCGWDDARERCVRAWPHLTDPNFAQATALCCSAPCGIAVKSRRRTCSSPEPRHGGRVCVGIDVDDIYCHNLPPCPGGSLYICKSRRRTCSSPEPRHGGRVCVGIDVDDIYCHNLPPCPGGSLYICKSRRRTCSSPEPRHGGRVCVGIDVDDIYCHNLPPCPARPEPSSTAAASDVGIDVRRHILPQSAAVSSLVDLFTQKYNKLVSYSNSNKKNPPDPALAPVDGGWSPWGPWSPCTSSGGVGCGPAGGMRERRRLCGSPAPLHGGADCDGPEVEKQACDMRPCEVRKTTAWTPWVQIPG